MSAPDERAFAADIAKPAFRLAVAEGRWRVVRVEWPYVFVCVTAKDGTGHNLRLNCEGYPQSPPTGGPWDLERNGSSRPRSGRGARAAASRPSSGWTGRAARRSTCPVTV